MAKADWHILLKDGTDHFFYCGYDADKNPLETIEEFDRGEFWCIDAVDFEDGSHNFQVDPQDDSFILIPKTSVVMVYPVILKDF